MKKLWFFFAAGQFFNMFHQGPVNLWSWRLTCLFAGILCIEKGF